MAPHKHATLNVTHGGLLARIFSFPMRLPLLLLLLPFILPAQDLRVVGDDDVERLVREVFSSGQCETITNIAAIGDNPLSLGYFEGGQSSVGFGRGIIVSTGDASLAVGPNEDTDTGYAHSERSTADLDLSSVSTGIIYDRAGIEFDFVPLTSTVTFRYVFASEEYCDFVGREFNDVFGFFISGPGIDGPYDRGAENIARLPRSGEAVSINNVNFGTNSEYYLDNEFPVVRRVNGCGGPGRPGPRFELIEYDGQTTILTATINVRPCQTYHLRMLIGDVRDRQLDSAVFLEAGSFNLGGSVTLGNAADDDAPVVVNEGCPGGEVFVRRGPDSDPTAPQTVEYRIGGASTVTEGADVDVGTGTVTLLPGEDSVAIPILAFTDELTEGEETAWLYLDVPCACYNDSVQIIIAEPGPLEIGLTEAFYCPGTPSTLRPRVTGGLPPYTYQWGFGSEEARPTLPAPLPDTLRLTVNDACGNTTQRAIPSSPSAPPTFSSPPQTLIGCRGSTVDMNIVLGGQAPFALSYAIGDRVEEATFTGDALQAWALSEGGRYRLIGLRDEACAIQLDSIFEVNFTGPTITARLTQPSCAGEDDGRIEIDHLRSNGPFEYEFTGAPSNGLIFTNLPAGNYTARVTDADGCSDFRELELLESEPIRPPRIDCDLLRRPPLATSAEGGAPPYRYSVDGSEFFGDGGLSGLEGGVNYDLRVRDSRGCEVEFDDFYWPVASRRLVRLPNFIDQELGGRASIELEYLVPTSQISTYRWQPAELFDCATCPRPTVRASESRSVSLVVQDIYGCTDSLVTQIAIDERIPVYVPNIFSPNDDGFNDEISSLRQPQPGRPVWKASVSTRGGAHWSIKTPTLGRWS